MRLARRPGSVVEFIDAFSGETILKMEADELGPRVSYRLYDCFGALVRDSDGPQRYPEGTEVFTVEKELLLAIPADAGAAVRYRLYSSTGSLLTSSDGLRTQIFGGLRVEGGPTPHRGRLPGASAATVPEAT